jgi:Xaa-Pro aminopeptidase
MTRREEIEAKEARVRAYLQRSGLKGVLLKSQHNFSWFTGGGLNVVTIADTVGVSSILVTPTERFLICDRIEMPRMTEDEGLAELFTFVQYEWFDGSEAAQVAKLVPPAEIGCDLPGFGYPYVGQEIQELRYELLPVEIERYLWMGEKASWAIESVLKDFVQPGMNESEVVGELSKILWKDRIDSMCYQSASDVRAYKFRHAIPTERTIEKYLMLNVNARKWGLVTTVTRIVHFGAVPERLRKQFADTVYIECGMMHETKPGASMKDIYAKTCKLYEDLGYPGEWRLHHQGGAQGYRNRDYLMKPSSPERVLENQCICWNPSIAGTKSEDAFIVQAKGRLMVTKATVFPTLTMTYGGETFVRPGLLER